MNKGLAVVGILAGITVALIAAFYTYQAHVCIEEYRSVLGTIGRGLSSQAQEEYETCHQIRFLGATFSVGGVVIAIISAALAD